MFETSRRLDEVRHEAYTAMADFLNASRPEEIIFGNNMTTLTLHLSRSLARNLQPGDNLLVTRLGHDANVSPWSASRRSLPFHRSPGHRKDKTVTFWNQIPEWVMSYNQYSSPISFSECVQ